VGEEEEAALDRAGVAGVAGVAAGAEAGVLAGAAAGVNDGLLIVSAGSGGL
jgi:hypothetical protein